MIDTQLLLIICLIALVVSAIAYIIDQRKRKTKGTSTAAEINKKLLVFYQKSYVEFSKLPILSKFILRVRFRLATINPYDELTLRRETMRITIRILLISLLLVTVMAIFSQSFVAVLFTIMGIILLNTMLINIFVKRVEDRLLIQLVNYLEEVRHDYQELKLVDQAIYQGAQRSPHTMKLQAERIHDILTSRDPKKELESFYSVAPNRYLKLFAGVSFLVMEYGDRVVKKGSMYLNSLSKLVREIRDDVLRRRRLSYRLSLMSIFALAPIVLTFPIKDWATTYFPIMEMFYEGTIGYILQIVIFSICIIFYLLLRKIGEIEEARYTAVGARRNWEKRLYELPVVQWIVDRIVPSKRSSKHFRITMLLKESNSPLTIEWFYIQRIVVSLACFIGVVALMIFLHWNTSHQVFTKLTSDTPHLMGYMTDEEKLKAKELTDFDNAVIKELKGEGRSLTREAVLERVMLMPDISLDEIALNKTVNRIIEKMQVLENQYFKWWELLIALGIGGVGFFIPLWITQFQKKMRNLEIQNEVDQFHVVISILSQFERMNVHTILEWMERYSVMFRPALRKAIVNFDSGPEQALKELKEDAPFISFVRVVNRLQLALEKISLSQAFDDLEMEQEFHREQKMDRMNQLINKKVFWGRACGWTPVFLLIFLYLLFPMIFVAIGQLNQTMTQLLNF
ncbi:hypothetical protein [Paenibacillus campinasensis]|uniref:GTPase SAR1 n=1 Tax=Paenibacillus campinasensis TaxID=66347 RepID=A0A268EE20_9BACL|nr:hypothetical protein [Paenibacillus campinasensis]PAD71340.1 hypothetical protein CHH67_24660 [Paenibacillus campinasensis]